MLYEIKIRENKETIDYILTLDIPEKYNIEDVKKIIDDENAYDIEDIKLYALPGDIKIKDMRIEVDNDIFANPLKVVEYSKINSLGLVVSNCYTPTNKCVYIRYETKLKKIIEIYITDIPEEYKNNKIYEIIGEYVYKLGLTFAILKWEDIKDKI